MIGLKSAHAYHWCRNINAKCFILKYNIWQSKKQIFGIVTQSRILETCVPLWSKCILDLSHLGVSISCLDNPAYISLLHPLTWRDNNKHARIHMSFSEVLIHKSIGATFGFSPRSHGGTFCTRKGHLIVSSCIFRHPRVHIITSYLGNPGGNAKG